MQRIPNKGHWIESNAPYVVLLPVTGVEEHDTYDSANQSRLDYLYRTGVDVSVLRLDMDGEGSWAGRCKVYDTDGQPLYNPDGSHKRRRLNNYVKVHDGVRL